MRRIEALPYNAKMLSPEIQNDLLQFITSILLEHIEHQVENVRSYAVVADKVNDGFEKELLGALYDICMEAMSLKGPLRLLS